MAAQPYNRPLGNDYNWLERQLSVKSSFHTPVKPLVHSFIAFDSLQIAENNRWQRKQHQSLFGRKLRNESMIEIDSGRFHVSIDPLFIFEYGKDLADTSLRADTTHFFRNTRGLRLQGNVGEKFAFSSSFYENQLFFPQYLHEYSLDNSEWHQRRGSPYHLSGFGMIPGEGRAKPYKNGGFDFGVAEGYISWMPLKSLNLQLGHGKHFIGEGYRSLLLSDNAFNYPYVKATVQFLDGKIQYMHLKSWLQSLNRLTFSSTAEALFERKEGTFNYLNFIPVNWLQIGLFEGIIWQRWDSLGTIDFNANSLNPILFVNTAIHGLNDKNNTVAGANIKLTPFDSYVFYGQFLYDDENKYGYQAGFKFFDLAGLKNLELQAEFNDMLPFTYSHTTGLQNYSHYNQPLAHPSGANFREIIGRVKYSWRDFFIDLKVNQITWHDENNGGRNIFESPDATGPPPDFVSEVLYQHVRLGYLLNPSANTNLTIGIMNRLQQNEDISRSTQFVYAGFRTSLFNRYYDF